MMDAKIIAVARAWASLEGHFDAYEAERSGRVKPDDPSYIGYVQSYEVEAEGLLKRVAARGFELVPVGGGWPPMRPMSEAPRDGTPILLRHTAFLEPVVGRWRQGQWFEPGCFRVVADDDECAGWWVVPTSREVGK